MPTFTPPVHKEYGDDWFFGRFGVPTGTSVLWNGASFSESPYPWLGELRPEGGPDLVEGETWFQGGRTYTVSEETAALLLSSGFATT